MEVPGEKEQVDQKASKERDQIGEKSVEKEN